MAIGVYWLLFAVSLKDIYNNGLRERGTMKTDQRD